MLPKRGVKVEVPCQLWTFYGTHLRMYTCTHLHLNIFTHYHILSFLSSISCLSSRLDSFLLLCPRFLDDLVSSFLIFLCSFSIIFLLPLSCPLLSLTFSLFIFFYPRCPLFSPLVLSSPLPTSSSPQCPYFLPVPILISCLSSLLSISALFDSLTFLPR